MSFLCNVAAGQHTPKSILESSEPRNVILAAALTDLRQIFGTSSAHLRHIFGTSSAHLRHLRDFSRISKGGGVTTNLAVDQADGAVDRRHFAGWGSAP